MIWPSSGVKIWLACGVTDMRRGMDSLAAQVQQKLAEDPFGGQVFVFRGRRGDLLKRLWCGMETGCACS
jgi:transposase